MFEQHFQIQTPYKICKYQYNEIWIIKIFYSFHKNMNWNKSFVVTQKLSVTTEISLPNPTNFFTLSFHYSPRAIDFFSKSLNFERLPRTKKNMIHVTLSFHATLVKKNPPHELSFR